MKDDCTASRVMTAVAARKHSPAVCTPPGERRGLRSRPHTRCSGPRRGFPAPLRVPVGRCELVTAKNRLLLLQSCSRLLAPTKINDTMWNLSLRIRATTRKEIFQKEIIFRFSTNKPSSKVKFHKLFHRIRQVLKVPTACSYYSPLFTAT